MVPHACHRSVRAFDLCSASLRSVARKRSAELGRSNAFGAVSFDGASWSRKPSMSLLRSERCFSRAAARACAAVAWYRHQLHRHRVAAARSAVAVSVACMEHQCCGGARRDLHLTACDQLAVGSQHDERRRAGAVADVWAVGANRLHHHRRRATRMLRFAALLLSCCATSAMLPAQPTPKSNWAPAGAKEGQLSAAKADRSHIRYIRIRYLLF